ncbi:MAG: two-component regulator propeller domain-containing protein [Bacteroidota bacterium]
MQLFFLNILILSTLIAGNNYLPAQTTIDFSKKDFLENLSSQSWTIEDELPTNDVNSIVKNKDGFYYIGTSNGFVRFDGSEFKVYNTKNTKAIKANVTRNLFIDSRNKVWFSNGGAGIVVYDGIKFTRISEDEGLSLNHPSSFAEDDKGRIYIGTIGGGLNIFDNGKISIFNKNEGLLPSVINTILIDSKNTLWVGGHDSDLFTIKNGKVEKFPNSTNRKFSRVIKLFEDSRGIIWVGTDNGVFIIKDENFISDNIFSILNNSSVNHITEDANKNIWFVSTKGIFIYDRRKLIRLNIDPLLNSNLISKVLINDDGIWICNPGAGLVRLTLNKIRVISKEHGLPDKEVRTIYQDNDNKIWIGTNKGIIQYNEKSGSVVPIPSKTPTLVPYAWASNAKGEIFIGTRNSGVWKYSNGTIKNIADKKILGANFIRSLYYNDDKTLWIGTNGAGVVLYKEGKLKFIDKSNGLKSVFVACIVKNKDGNFWIGTSGGGISLVDNNGTVLKSYTEKDGLPSNIISSIYEDEKGTVWVSSGVFGLSRLKDGKIFNIQENDGIYSNSIKKMIYDNKGKFWCTTEFGLFSVEKSVLENYADGHRPKVVFNLYGKKDGMKSDNFLGLSNNAASISNTGLLYFPSTDGVVIIDPKKLVGDDKQPKVYIDEVFVNHDYRSKDDINILPPGIENIQFNYGGISVDYAKNLSYKYILEGFEKKFVDAGSRRQAFYTHLPHGSYKFRVFAISPNGARSENEAAISFKIEPYMWQTYWFRIGLILSLVAGSALTVRTIYKRKYKRRMEILENESMLNKERMRISKDMHDELGASLTKISLMTELAARNILSTEILKKDLKKISDTSREVAVTMDEIVWAVNPNNDKLDRMIGYILQYIEDLISNTSIILKSDIVRNLPEIIISAEARHNVFLVVKEAFNNIIKHSEATHVNLTIDFNDSVLSIKIRDNGKGIDLSSVDIFSNGLSNMKKRIDDIKGTIILNCAPGEGTEIIIRLTL